RGYVLLHGEPEFDCADGAAALAALKGAEFVVALAPFQSRAFEFAHAILPIAPFTETAGTFVSTEGRAQSFRGVVEPLGEARPAWKVLRVLGNLLGLEGFGYDSAEEVKNEALGVAGADLRSRLDNALVAAPALELAAAPSGLERIGDVPIHFADPIVRRAPALQSTADAQTPHAWMHGATLAAHGIAAGERVKIVQGSATALLIAARDDRLPANCVRVAAGHPATAGLGALQGPLILERVAAAALAAV
ncbi:MAG: molybdopterin-dependent oxidoreductase, partial [Betaproteobacteria bacterium]